MGLSKLDFPIGIVAWKINKVQADVFISSSETSNRLSQCRHIVGDIYSWEDNGPVLVLSHFGLGIIFASAKEAEKIIPNLRHHGFTKDEFFWYLIIEREVVNELLLEPENTTRIHRLEYGPNNTVYALNKPKGFLTRIALAQGAWYEKIEHVKQMRDFILEVEEMF